MPKAGKRMIYRRYTNDQTTSEVELQARSGQEVTLIGDWFHPEPDEPDIVMHRIRFDDGYEDEAFVDELFSLKEEA